jgi:hypothetical protein
MVVAACLFLAAVAAVRLLLCALVALLLAGAVLLCERDAVTAARALCESDVPGRTRSVSICVLLCLAGDQEMGTCSCTTAEQQNKCRDKDAEQCQHGLLLCSSVQLTVDCVYLLVHG